MVEHPKGYCPVFGNYPKEYNRAVHGPYYPWVNYGPRDTPFYEVKLGEFPAWFARRNKTPQAVISTVSRYMWAWRHKWVETRYGSLSKPLFQFIVLASVFSMLDTYSLLRMHRGHKYHW